MPSYTELVKISDNEYSFNTILPFKTHQQKFVPDQEIEQKTADGRFVKNTFSIEENKLIEKQVEPNRQVTIVFEYKDNVMEGTATVKNDKNEVVKCKAWSDYIEF
jgi:general stress protein 26